MIFNIQRYSTHDGPGIRTVVFLKGCSLGCRWCQNPESRARTQDLLYDPRLCLEGCELCAKAAPEVIERALNGLLIHREKLTLSGGEPFMQPEMATALLQASHEAGIHTAVETCLHVPWKYIAPSLPYIDLFLADLKHVADAPFKQWTDGNAARVLDNLKKLAAAGKKIIIRVPLIQGFNADETSVKAITDFAADELHVSEIHFLPYHTLGINKYHLINLP